MSKLLELIFQGFVEWSYGLVLECWEYFASALLEVMSMDFAYLKSHIPVLPEIQHSDSGRSLTPQPSFSARVTARIIAE